MFDIQKFIDIDYATDVRKARRKSKEVNSQEFFTPYAIVKNMCEKISEDDWKNPNKTFLEPCAGSGNFVIMIIYLRMQHGIDWKTALKTCFALDLMQDNVDEMKERVHKMLSEICPDYVGVDTKTGCVHTPYNKTSAARIMDKNLVCCDFFTWNFKEWREMTEEEIKQSKKKK